MSAPDIMPTTAPPLAARRSHSPATVTFRRRTPDFEPIKVARTGPGVKFHVAGVRVDLDLPTARQFALDLADAIIAPKPIAGEQK